MKLALSYMPLYSQELIIDNNTTDESSPVESNKSDSTCNCNCNLNKSNSTFSSSYNNGRGLALGIFIISLFFIQYI